MSDEFWYRYEAKCYATWNGLEESWSRSWPRLSLRTYRVLSHTPKGVWIEYAFSKRFDLRDARRRFACPTKEEALESFCTRKRRQIQLLKGQLDEAQYALSLAIGAKSSLPSK